MSKRTMQGAKRTPSRCEKQPAYLVVWDMVRVECAWRCKEQTFV